MRYHNLLVGLSGLLMALGLFSGCTDDPAHQADRKIQKKTDDAMDLLIYKGDVEQARFQLDSALSIRSGGLSRDSAFLASGNLELSQIRQQAADLELQKLPAQRDLVAIQDQIHRVLKLQLQQQRVRQLIDSGDQEIQELREVLEGNGQSLPGLRKELAEVQAQLQQLEVQRQEWKQKEAAADSRIGALQAQADAQFQEAKSAPADQQPALEQAAYQILLQKKDYYFDKQEAVTHLEQVDSRIGLISPAADRLEAYIRQTEEKIARLEQSEELAKLRDQQKQLSKEISGEQGTLRDQLSRFKQEVARYQKASDQVLASLETVLGQYENIQSRGSRATVLYKKAQTQALMGIVHASRLLFESNVTLAVEGMIKSVEGMIKSMEGDAALRDLLQAGLLIVAEDQLLAGAVESFDLADQTFEQALSEGRALGGEPARQFTLNVTQSRLLNLHAKMRLADLLDRYELAEKTQGVLDEQIQKAAELGPGFTQSETAKLLEKGLNYVPRMPYDSELYFESIRPLITAWRQVQGTPAQKEAAARQILQLIGQYEAEADETLLRLLQPEKQALQSAIERGFAEEILPPGPRPMYTEPNSL